MSELGETFRAGEAQKKLKKDGNRESSTRWLEEKGIRFESKNFGIHLVVESPCGKVDFWPSTGKWMSRKTRHAGRGVRNLIKFIERQQHAQQTKP